MSNQKNNLIAKKYSEALASVKLDESIMKDLDTVQEAFIKSPELNDFLANPAIQIDNKKAAIKEIFSSKVSKEVLSILLLLLDRRRISVAPQLNSYYKEAFYKSANIELAQVDSVKSLKDAELNEIKAKLEKLLDKKVEVSNDIDESLIAGLKIKVAGKVIDSSLKTKIKAMKQVLSQ